MSSRSSGTCSIARTEAERAGGFRGGPHPPARVPAAAGFGTTVAELSLSIKSTSSACVQRGEGSLDGVASRGEGQHAVPALRRAHLAIPVEHRTELQSNPSSRQPTAVTPSATPIGPRLLPFAGS